ncbi:MAG: hypothetical protein P8X68_21150 [Desulfobacterales bacterium]|jgi:hypothetical protein
MQQPVERWLIVPAALAIFILSPVSVFAEGEWVYGKAINRSGELEFIEEHIIDYEDERIVAIKTVYYDADFNKIGEQVSDFVQGPQFGSYEFVDERLRYIDGARVMQNQILVFRRDIAADAIEKKYLPRDSRQVVGQGFHQFIVANLDSLVRGAVISAKLVLPAQLDQFDIRIGKHQIEGNRLQVRIELDNWFLSLFTPHVEAEYDLTTRRLLTYRGLSMIADKSGKTVEVTVSYDYSQRRPMLSSQYSSTATRSKRN